MKKRIVLTDLALVTPLGQDLQTTWHNLQNNITGFSDIYPGELPGLPVTRAGKIALLDGQPDRWLSLFELLTHQVSLKTGSDLFYTIGTVFGGVRDYSFRAGVKRSVQEKTGCPEERIIFHTNTCAAGNFAIYNGVNLIKTGMASTVVCGGIDILSPYLFAGFSSLRSLSRSQCTPFAAGRDGLSLGEGGALLVLQDLEKALDEGSRIICEYGGFGTSCDLKGVTSMDKSGQGIGRCIMSALDDACLNVEDIDLISTHGTGTTLNDSTEGAALQHLFGSFPFIQAFKSYWGHCMGASSAIEAVLLAKTLETGLLIKLGHELPCEFSLNFVRENRSAPVEQGLNTAFGFGGVNSCLVLKRYHE